MVDRENVIKRLENTAGYFRHLQSVGFFGDQPVYREHEQNCNDALALLKEQEAVEPKHNPLSPTDWFCGKCGMCISRFHDYCPSCGQAVKWE